MDTTQQALDQQVTDTAEQIATRLEGLAARIRHDAKGSSSVHAAGEIVTAITSATANLPLYQLMKYAHAADAHRTAQQTGDAS